MTKKRVQLTLDEELLKAVDRLTETFQSNRSALARQALRHEIQRIQNQDQLEEKCVEGYRNQPDKEDDLTDFTEAQHWLEK